MIKLQNKKSQTQKRHRKVRVKISGTPETPRLAVYKSIKHIYAQIIDDVNKVTLASASSVDKELSSDLKHGGNVESAEKVGELLAQRAKKAKIKDVVFDRGGFKYTGRVAALADALRKAGLNF